MKLWETKIKKKKGKQKLKLMAINTHDKWNLIWNDFS